MPSGKRGRGGGSAVVTPDSSASLQDQNTYYRAGNDNSEGGLIVQIRMALFEQARPAGLGQAGVSGLQAVLGKTSLISTRPARETLGPEQLNHLNI